MVEMMGKVAKVGSVCGIMQEMMLQGLLQGTLTRYLFYIMKLNNKQKKNISNYFWWCIGAKKYREQCKHFLVAMNCTIIIPRYLLPIRNRHWKKLITLILSFRIIINLIAISCITAHDERSTYRRLSCLASRLWILVSKWLLVPRNGICFHTSW